MKEINIAKTLIAKRKEKGITQDELAAYIGVSKASVSKWETGQSYPDIVLLPQLATYFNISIDELMGYSPQMTKEDIRKLYHRLSNDFSHRPFDEVIDECNKIIKKYYSCFPLLLQMAILLLNHHMLAPGKEEQEKILDRIIHLCLRIKNESQDIWLSKQANSLEALCYLILGKPEEVLGLLDSTIKPSLDDEPLLVNAYQRIGQTDKAIEVLQISTYQHLINLLANGPLFLNLYSHDVNKFEQILERFLTTAQVFGIDKLHPNTLLQIYLSAAQGYILQGNTDRSLDMIKKYADLCSAFNSQYCLHGDEFFDKIDPWLNEFDLGVKTPRDDKIIRESMIQALISNPAFAPLQDDARFKTIVSNLNLKLGG